jgi:hypothetical protein
MVRFSFWLQELSSLLQEQLLVHVASRKDTYKILDFHRSAQEHAVKQLMTIRT